MKVQDELIIKPLHLSAWKPKYFNQRAKYLPLYDLRPSAETRNNVNRLMRQIRLLAQTHTDAV